MADMIHTTPRRAALRGALAATLAGLATPALAATISNPDAELIRLCGQIEALEERYVAILRAQVTEEDEKRDDPALEAIGDEKHRLFELLPEPTTMEGAKALARAAVATAPHYRDGSLVTGDMTEWMAYAAVEFLASDGRGGAIRKGGFGAHLIAPTPEEQAEIDAEHARRMADATSDARTEEAINSMSPDTLEKLADLFRHRRDDGALWLARVEARLQEIGA